MSLPPLSPEQQVKPKRFELRISLLFVALFLPMGVHLPYLPLWLEAEGFDAEQIAVILSAPMFVRMISTPFFTTLADRAPDRALVFIAISAAGLFVSLGYFLPPSFGLVLAVSVALAIFMAPQSPIADSLALSGVRRFGSSYPSMRLWGSISFLTANFCGGLVLAWTGSDAVPVMISAGMALTILAGIAAPRLGRPRVASALSASKLVEGSSSPLGLYFVLLVTGAGIVNASHGFIFGFGSIYWKSIGIGDTVVGMLWAFAVLAEVVVFVLFTRVFGNLRTTTVLAISGLAAMARWAVYPYIEPLGFGIGGFFAAQSLHSLSTGLILIGVQKLIAETVPDPRTGAAQGINFFVSGLSMAAVTLASGPLYEQLGAHGFLAMVGVAGLGLALILVAVAVQPQSAGSGGDTSDPS